MTTAKILSDKKTELSSHDVKGNLREGPLLRHMMRLTWPMIIGIGAIIAVQLADTYFIGKLGTDHLAAISFTFPVTYAVLCVIIGFSIATASIISRLIGQGDQNEIKRSASWGMVLAFGLSMIMGVIGILISTPLFRFMDAEDHIIPLILDYTTIWFAGAWLIAGPMVGNSVLRAHGDTRTPALLMCFIAVINLALDPILIFGFGPIPGMGLRGAAIATIAAYAFGLALMIFILCTRLHILTFQRISFSEFTHIAKQFLSIALPAGIANSMPAIVNSFIIAQVALTGASEAIGTKNVAAFGVGYRIESFVMIPLMALATGIAPIIGQNWGAQKMERVQHTIILSLKFMVIWCVSIAAILGLMAPGLAALFSDSDRVLNATILFLYCLPLSYVGLAAVNGWGSIFNAMGYPKQAFFILLIKNIIITIPFVIIGKLAFGYIGLLIGIAAANLLCGAVIHLYCYRQYKIWANQITG